jgi:hypothetical protein
MPPGWDATRARILARDRACWCGAPATEVHHLLPGVEEDWALRGICHPHHLAITLVQAMTARWPDVPRPRPTAPASGAASTSQV